MSLKGSPALPSMVSLTKRSGKVTLEKSDGNWYTLICVFDRKDYDLLVLVVYNDGTSEWISAFGTEESSRYTLRSRTGEVVHTGDRATTDRGGKQAFELVHIQLTKDIAAIIPVVYSAQNSGIGSFRMYGVSTYVLPGKLDKLPNNLSSTKGIIVNAKRASWNPFRYSFVPCVIRNTRNGGELDPSQQKYSRMFTERRPSYDAKVGKVKMNRGPRNAGKTRPV